MKIKKKIPQNFPLKNFFFLSGFYEKWNSEIPSPWILSEKRNGNFYVFFLLVVASEIKEKKKEKKEKAEDENMRDLWNIGVWRKKWKTISRRGIEINIDFQ